MNIGFTMMIEDKYILDKLQVKNIFIKKPDLFIRIIIFT